MCGNKRVGSSYTSVKSCDLLSIRKKHLFLCVQRNGKSSHKCHAGGGSPGKVSIGRECILCGSPQLTINTCLKREGIVGKFCRCVMKLGSPFLCFLTLRRSPSNFSHSGASPQNSVQQSNVPRWWMNPVWTLALWGKQVSPAWSRDQLPTLQTAPANTSSHLPLYLPLNNPSSGFLVFCIVIHLNCHSLWQVAGFSNAG